MMPTHHRSASLSLLGTLAAAVTILAALSSLGGEWTAPPAATPAVTPRGTVPLPPGMTPLATPTSAASPTPPGIAPSFGAERASPTPSPTDGISPAPSPGPTLAPSPSRESADSTATPMAGQQDTATPPPTPGGGLAVAAGGFPAIIPSATAITLDANAGATLVAGDGAILVTVAPGALTPGGRLRYDTWTPPDAARRAALDARLLLTNLAFRLTLEPPGAWSQAPQGAGAGALAIQVSYQPSQVSGIDPASLGLYRYDAPQGAWQSLSCQPTADRPGLGCHTDRPGDFLLAGTRPSLPAGGTESRSATGTEWLVVGLGLFLLGAGGIGWARWRQQNRSEGAS
ncbi:MAG: hypothetical protein HY689_10430 [Chloroflexi bacterium]|nr:hypothetical protein [Chloroflexota bacterium]